jgi:hypothetical protein
MKNASIYNIIDKGIIIDSNEFIYNSLFCEWAYIVNFDSRFFEIYRGFQKYPHNKGRYSLNKTIKNNYCPCALIKEYKFNEIPNDWHDKI